MTTANPADATCGDRCVAVDEYIPDALVVALAMVVLDEFVNRSAEATLPERNDPMEAFFFDRAHGV